MTDSELNLQQSACDALIAGQQTLLLATRSADGNADISYAPYLRDGETFYIFVSELARHTQNLFNHPQASILFIEAETEAVNPFARQRLTFNCQVREIPKSAELYTQQLAAMAEKFGDIVTVLRTLPDFHLMALTPQQGWFVAGFGQALAVTANGRLQPAASTTGS